MNRTKPTRRTVLKLSGAAFAVGSAQMMPGLAAVAQAQSSARHGLSVFGDLKYGPDFTHFEYANPDAPKGGTFSFQAPYWYYNQNVLTYNTFNAFVLKGDAPPRMELCFDTLMVRAWDEPDAVYGLVAETVEVSEDGNTFHFNLRPEARFHDGSKLTAEDAAFSLLLLKEKGHPLMSQPLNVMRSAEAVEDYRLRIEFDGTQSRAYPLTVAASYPIFSKRYYTAYDFAQSTLTPPLSSGPYEVGDHAVGKYVEYHKVSDYWGKDLPVIRGQKNFDVVRVEFFRERQVAFEAFKKGEVNYREEFSSKNWATEYNFPAVEDGRVKTTVFPDGRPSGAQGWFLNTRREKFKDPRVREALGYAFDFEWSNKNLFYDLYKRTVSFFENTDMKAEGLPSEAELALLEPFREDLPEAAFGEPVTPPVSDGSGADRALLRRANELLLEAGFTRQGSELLGPDGQPLEIEFLNNTTVFERITNPFIKNLSRLGIKANFRVVDGAQYQARLNDYDFDIASRRFSFGPTLSDTIRDFWGSDAAATPGTYNIAGISNPAIDALMDRIIASESRDEMTTAARALDRVLRAGHYWVPQWNSGTHKVAMWDMFGYPEKTPQYFFPVEDLWWIDEEKAEKLGKAG
ncbi:ABC transporter substrate-binding protein [Roseibium denhamense]|uniref:Microcin C transport system substrate-binding protein n=1 Tax=Roseibium denhamense TaxID=76305 RepID=A0ABY1PLG7_9HYPH|nr:extracellular solute-binding protein [Roseibium denhamense]MTI06911.1 ABC transporter substrate-binding protein [Roseibium denhamense]SMP36781.1 microcin C transport system substrate-binding protein [Roseibium denhamense]